MATCIQGILIGAAPHKPKHRSEIAYGQNPFTIPLQKSTPYVWLTFLKVDKTKGYKL